jgi:hypothetical protein|tara:strand:+ start:3628 stop:4089 length:462 start_codon:yes stop_codon:yes gene_type:complete
MDRISKHITYKEGIRSNTALRRGIDNTPGDYELSNMNNIAVNLFEPLREWVGGPIKITSFFRCEELNKAIGGSSRSQHCQGRAMDLDDTFGHKTNAEMFEYIKSNLSYDQLIWEFGDDENPDWIHVSFVSEMENRGRSMRAQKVNGRTNYSII